MLVNFLGDTFRDDSGFFLFVFKLSIRVGISWKVFKDNIMTNKEYKYLNDNFTKLTIKCRLDGLNEYTRQNRGSYKYGAYNKRKNQARVMNYIDEQLRDVHFDKVKIHIVWHEQDKRRDTDNIAFAKKFIFDALVKCNVIPDDSMKYVLGFSDDFVINKSEPKVEVFIEDASDEEVLELIK